MKVILLHKIGLILCCAFLVNPWLFANPSSDTAIDTHQYSQNAQANGVGVTAFSTVYPIDNQRIRGLIWYPSTQVSQTTHFGGYSVAATLDATLDVKHDANLAEGRHGLVFISHGSGGSHLGHRDTAIYLAKRHYLVVSLLHPENNFLDNSAEGKTRNWANRPKHISASLDYLLNQSQFAAHIDLNNVSVIGHSAGGATALALLGGVPDTVNLLKHCQRQRDSGICTQNTVTRFLSSVSSWMPWLFPTAANPLNGLADTRFKSAIVLAPMGVLFAHDDALKKVSSPTLILRASQDAILKYPFHAEMIHNRLSAKLGMELGTDLSTNVSTKHEYQVIAGAGHFSFIAPFPDHLKSQVGLPALDPEGFDRIAFHQELNERIFRFIEQVKSRGN